MNTHEHLPERPAFPGAGQTRDKTARASGAFPFVSSAILLGTIGIFVHEADTDPITATWFRCAFGLFGLTLWALLRRQMIFLRLTGSTWFCVLSAGALMVLAWGLFFAAIERTSAGVATVLFHIQPLWVLVLGAWWLKESIAKQRVVSVLVAMVGLVLATGMPEQLSSFAASEAFKADYWIGVTLCLLGAFCTACVTIIARRLRDMPDGILAWWQCAVGTLALAVWPMTQGWPEWGASWVWLSGLGLIHTGLAYTLMYAGMARLSTDRIAILQFIYPAVAIVIDWLFYAQSLGTLQLSGIALMAGAIWFAAKPSVSASSPRR